MSNADFEWELQMNFFTTVRACRAALGPMVPQGSGAIVNLASISAFFQAWAATIDYGAAKAAVVNLSLSLAQEFGPARRGPNRRGRDGRRRRHRPQADHRRSRGLATGRFTTPEEVATLVVLLASVRTASVTGANDVIDGGLVKTI